MLKVDIHSISAPSFTHNKLRSALNFLEKAVNHPTFRQLVLNHSYPNEEFEIVRGFHHTSDSCEEIYSKIMSGKDIYSESDSDIDIRWQIINMNDESKIGYTTRDSNLIVTGYWFIKKRKPMSIAGHLMHEYMHNLGYEHEDRNTRLREFSVPYAVGDIVKKIAWQLFRG